MNEAQKLQRECRQLLKENKTDEALDRLLALHMYVGQELHEEIKMLFQRSKTGAKGSLDEASRQHIHQSIEELLERCEKENIQEKPAHQPVSRNYTPTDRPTGLARRRSIYALIGIAVLILLWFIWRSLTS